MNRKKLVSISRYQDYFPTLSTDIKEDVYRRIDQLILEEKEYCDKGNYKHMAQILTSIVLYCFSGRMCTDCVGMYADMKTDR